MNKKKSNICPKCKSDNTYCVNELLEYNLERFKCKDCNCLYEVKYELIVKEVNIKN